MRTSQRPNASTPHRPRDPSASTTVSSSMKSSIILASALILCAGPAAAQEWGVNRRFFTFLDNEVTVEVSAETGGRLHVIRGEQGRIEVSARVDGGMSSFALGG